MSPKVAVMTATAAPDSQAKPPFVAAGPGPWAWAALLALGVIWGGSFTAVGFAVAALPPLGVASGRLVVAALLLLPLAYAFGPGLPRFSGRAGRRVWLSALGVALSANVVPFILLSWAQTHVASGLAGVCMATMPLMVLGLAARFVEGERLTTAKAQGFVLGFLGVAALFGREAMAAFSGAPAQIVAMLACFGAAAGYAIGSIVTKLSPPCHPLSFGAAAIGLAAAIAAPIGLIFAPPWTVTWSWDAAFAVIMLGVFPTALAQLLLLFVIRRAGPTFLSLVNYQVPLWALAFGVLFLSETMPVEAPIALVLILAGVALSQGRLGVLPTRLALAPADRGPFAAVVFLVLVWGTAFFAMKVAVAEAAPSFVAGARTWFGAAAVMGAALLLGRRLPTDRRVWAWCAFIGMLSIALPFSLLAWAAQHTESGVIGVYMAVIPLVILPLAHVLSPTLGLGEIMTLEKAIGVLIGFLGVMCLFGFEGLSALGTASAQAQLACLGAALAYAFGSISIRAMPRADPIVVAGLQLCFGALYIAPFAVLAWPSEPLSFGVWSAILILGLGATGAAMTLRVYVIGEKGPVYLSTVGYLVPLTALATGALFGAEQFGASDMLGAALIFAGLAVSRGALTRLLAPSRPRP